MVPAGAARLTCAPGLIADSVVEVPSTVTTASTPVPLCPVVSPSVARAVPPVTERVAALPCSVVESWRAPVDDSDAVTPAPAAFAAALTDATSADGVSPAPGASVRV